MAHNYYDEKQNTEIIEFRPSNSEEIDKIVNDYFKNLKRSDDYFACAKEFYTSEEENIAFNQYKFFIKEYLPKLFDTYLKAYGHFTKFNNINVIANMKFENRNGEIVIVFRGTVFMEGFLLPEYMSDKAFAIFMDMITHFSDLYKTSENYKNLKKPNSSNTLYVDLPLKKLVDAYYGELQFFEQIDRFPEEMCWELEEFMKNNQEWLKMRKLARKKSQE